MPIPPLDQFGLLAAGIHDSTLDEIKGRFGSFQSTGHRQSCSKSLSRSSPRRAARFATCLLIDGSFVTAKTDPNDIDLVLVLPLTHDLKSDLSPGQYNLVSKRSVQDVMDLI